MVAHKQIMPIIYMQISLHLLHRILIMSNKVLNTYKSFQKLPFGNWLFSKAVGFKTPYFRSISPLVKILEPGQSVIFMKKKWSITNHIKSVHAIAMCNVCEFAAGLCIEVSIPAHKRWIPKSMSVNYIKIARTDLTAYCEIKDIDWETTDVLEMYVAVKDKNEILVMDATIGMKISDKK